MNDCQPCRDGVKHVHETPPTIGVPYAQAGVLNGMATAECPRCGHQFIGETHKAVGRIYAEHYEKVHASDDAIAFVKESGGFENAVRRLLS